MLTVIGLNHRTASIAIREKVTVPDRNLPDVLSALGHGVVVSTCNRTEIYQADGHDSAEEAAQAFFRDRLETECSGVEPHLYRLDGEAALRHLFAVAAGLDSMVLGEAQILGQVRLALEQAEQVGTADAALARAFRHAVRVGRRARAETFIGRHTLSVSYAAVDLARGVFGSLAGCRALVVGAGEMGELTAQSLADNGVGVVAVANRTFERAEDLATRFGGRPVALDRLAPALREADIVISSTDAPHYVISEPEVRQAVRDRVGRPLFLIDIAVPRDVDPVVRETPGVILYDIDDLRARCELNLAGRRAEIHRVQRIVDEEIDRFRGWWQARRTIPSIIALRQKAEAIRQEELQEALRMFDDLSEENRRVVDDLTRAIVNKILHAPTVGIRQLASADDAELSRARALLGLDEDLK
jgi:glutamyl-tRNA reductase